MQDYRKLHPLFLLVGTLQLSLKLVQSSWYLIIPLVLSKHAQDNLWLIGLVVLGAIVLFAVVTGVKYLTFRYQITDQQLEIRSGWLNKRVAHIPLTRIQSVSSKQDILLQVLGLYEVQIDTAGQGEVAAKIPLVDKAALDDLKALDRGQGQVVDTDAELEAPRISKEEVLVRSDTATIAKYSMSGLNIWAMIAMFLLVLGFAGEVMPDKIADQLVLQLKALSMFLMGIVFAIAMGAVILAIFIKDFNQYYDFQLTQRDSLLTSRAGLLTKREKHADIRRFQAIGAERKLLRRLLGLWKVFAETSSSFEDDESLGLGGRFILAPVLSGNPFTSFGKWVPDQADMISVKPDKKTWWLRFRILSWWRVLALVAATSFVAYFGGFPVLVFSVLLLIFVGWAGFTAYLQTKDSEIAYSEDVLFVSETEGAKQTISYVPYRAVQSVKLTQSIWMGKRGLAHLEVTIRSGNLPVFLTVRYLDSAQAQAVRAIIEEKIS
jgi:putative membrane protein